MKLELLEIDDRPILQEGDKGTENNKYGFEGGTIIKQQGVYHLFTAEVCDEPKVVKTKLAYWNSEDGDSFSRIATLYESSGNFEGTDPRASLWAPMPIFNEQSNRWNLFYIAYRAAPKLPGVFNELTFRHNTHGTIIRAESEMPGLEGLSGPYTDRETSLQPGEESDWWEGTQGTDSFYPYRTEKEWLSFYGSWRSNTAWNNKQWFGVGLAASQTLEGKWNRCSDRNPVLLDPCFVENPIVVRIKPDLFIAVYDTGPDRPSIGYAFSRDGYHWPPGDQIFFPKGVPAWRGTLRTPLCFLPEGDNIFTIYYTAFHSQGFIPNEEPRHHSGYGIVGRIKVKLII